MRSLLAVSILLSLPACQSTSLQEVESYVKAEDGLLLHFRKIGSGPDVLVVPGGSWVSQDLEDLARNRTVIFYDLRGRGRSDPATTVDLEKDLNDLESIRRWFKLERFSLLGVHYQAALAALYTSLRPEKVDRLVLVSPIPARKEPFWAIYARMFDDRLGEDMSAVLQRLRREGLPRTDPERWAEAYKQELVEAIVADSASARRMRSTPFVEPNRNPELMTRQHLALLAKLNEWDWREELRRVTPPTLVVYGDKDPMPPEASEEWIEAIPNADRLLFENCGRIPWVEHPSRFLSSVDSFLNAPANP